MISEIKYVRMDGSGGHIFSVDEPIGANIPINTFFRIEASSLKDAEELLQYTVNSIKEGSEIHYYGCVTYTLSMDSIAIGIAIGLGIDVLIRLFL